MRIEAKLTIGTDPQAEYVGSDLKLLVNVNLAENHNQKVGDKWVTKSTSWFSAQAWGEVAQKMIDDELKQGDFIDIKGYHKINKKQEKNEKTVYYPVYTITDYEIINRKR